MLIAREQPPLDPAKTSLYENPLYRPPSNTAAVGVKNDTYGNKHTSTFNPPPSAQYGSAVSLGTGHKPAASAPVPVGQRPPPAYVAAL